MEPDWRDEFVDLMSSPRREDWERARLLKMSKLPPHLYRYRRVSDHSLRDLLRQSIWLSPADQFNDLHDTTTVLDLGPAVEASLAQAVQGRTLDVPGINPFLPPVSQDILGAFDALFEAEMEQQGGKKAAGKARGFYRNFLSRMSAEWTEKTSKFFQRATKIACFCEAADVLLLWAHYADSSKGFCVEYPIKDVPQDDIRLRWLLPVVYRAEKFSLTTLILKLGGKPNPCITWLTTIHKSPEWAYEREWRIVDAIGDDAPGREVGMPLPSRLILGNRMAPENRAKVVGIARALGIPLFQAVPSSDGYKLAVEPVPT